MIQEVIVFLIVLATIVYLIRYYQKRFSAKKKASCGGCEKNCEPPKEATISFPKALAKFSHSAGKPFSNHERQPPSSENTRK